jgi:hypothetical protein
MNLLQNKSGQATLIIVMVTLAAVIGVAATSSTQSSFSLRNTVYGIQSEQALACAEAGAEKILGVYKDNDDPINGGSDSIQGTLTGSECGYQTTISDYPDNSGKFTISRLNENSVIELKVSQDISGASIDKITLLNDGSTDGGLAFYVYNTNMDAPRVARAMFYCGSGSTPQDFESTSFNSNDNSCTNINLRSLESIDQGSIIRIRALNNDLKLDFSGFTSGGRGVPIGNYILSTGTSGSVERKVKVYRFYRQMSDFFDEAVAIVD